MTVDIAGLTNAVTKTAVTVKTFDVIKSYSKNLEKSTKSTGRKSKSKGIW